jgi:hypothetical protein
MQALFFFLVSFQLHSMKGGTSKVAETDRDEKESLQEEIVFVVRTCFGIDLNRKLAA